MKKLGVLKDSKKPKPCPIKFHTDLKIRRQKLKGASRENYSSWNFTDEARVKKRK